MGKESLPNKELNIVCECLAALAVRSGFDRKDIFNCLDQYISAELSSVSDSPRSVDTKFAEGYRDLLAGIISAWRSNSKYTDDHGLPIAIPLQGPPPSFDALYKSMVSRYDQILVPLSFDESTRLLVDNGGIEFVEDGMVQIKSHIFRVSSENKTSINAQFAYLAEFASTIKHNIEEKPGEGHFQFVTSVAGFPSTQLSRVNEILNSHGVGLLEFVDNFLETQSKVGSDSPEPPKAKRVRVGVGVYFYQYPQ